MKEWKKVFLALLLIALLCVVSYFIGFVKGLTSDDTKHTIEFSIEEDLEIYLEELEEITLKNECPYNYSYWNISQVNCVGTDDLVSYCDTWERVRVLDR